MHRSAKRSVGAHELKMRGISLAWREVAPVPVARHADTHCTCCSGTQAFLRTLAHIMSALTLPTLALGWSAKRALHRASRAARSARRLRHPYHQEAMRASYRGSSTCRRPGRAQRARLRRRARTARRQPGFRRGMGAQRPPYREAAMAAASPGAQARCALGTEQREA